MPRYELPPSESQLPQLLEMDISPWWKLALTYASAKHIVYDVFTNYHDKQNIYRAKNLVSNIVDLFAGHQEALSSIVDLTLHDYYTHTHSLHVCLYGTATALRIYPDKAREMIKQLSFGFLMHDIGKTKLDASILKRPGKLTEDEWRDIKKHAWWGYRILENMKELTPDVANVILHHHERVDGSGYPSGLKGHAMGAPARICAFADIFDAMTTDRPYQKGLPAYDVLTYMRDGMECLDDHRLFDVFVKLFI